ncbi:UDP-N-acetyl-D-glucosamine dehydrogenase [Natribacillus halophilus]|uniref:UDP-N-acetyl-D-glucosamine dehydrogenase n=1 Tax=Natribacillus halophilus TaxID=549003 RepID=A0A1G8P1Z0_9BACI|nr:UDP-N-acetyl-D-glucosamine dehydrogenase [Natribacillus halophilus]
MIGLGYVGLPLALLFARKGYEVTGIDTDQGKITDLENHNSYIPDISDSVIKSALSSGKLTLTTNDEAVTFLDIIVICVPTPLTNDGDPDLRFLSTVSEDLFPRLQNGQLVILESSTYPGTTRDVIQPILEKSDLRVGENLYLGYSPERLDPGNQRLSVEEIPKVVSGISDHCLTYTADFYHTIFEEIVPASSVEVAELSKLLENSYRFINISFINEIAMLCDRLDINAWEAIDSAATKPYGFTPFFPGPGIGGHCIPVDPLYLYWVGQKHGFQNHFLALSEQTNQHILTYVTEQVKQEIEKKKNIKDANILLCGISYKKDSNDVRHSPSLQMMRNFRQMGAEVGYHDPYVPEVVLGGQTFKSLPLTNERLAQTDGVVIGTDHSTWPLQKMLDHAMFIYDTRNQTKDLTGKAKVIVLGGGDTEK